MLKLADLRKTTRRAKHGDLRIVYPHLLRDRSLVPRIQMAVRYLESMLGRPKRELDEEVIVQLFGDHKIARCVVACLAASYRHRARAFADVLPAGVVADLAAAGVTNPSELRLWLFRRANRGRGPGFVGGAERANFLRDAGAELVLTVDQIELLITLDAPANAVLVRVGPEPTAEDVIARFNYETAAALLANAPVVRVSLSRAPSDAQSIRALCHVAGVQAELSGRELVLHGRQDALNGWARNGAKLVRLLSALLACGLPARSAEALVAAPLGEWLFRLDADALGDLGARSNEASAALYSTDALLACWQRAEAFASDFAALRREGRHEGWSLRRAAEPVVASGAVVPALFYAHRGNQRVPLVLAPSGASSPLASLAARMPLLALDASAGDARPANATAPTLRYSSRDDVAALPSLLGRAVGESDARAELARVEAAFAEVGQAGVVTEPRLADLLGCDEEEVPLRLAIPAARAARQERDVQYIEGFGLCTAETLERARAASAEVEELRAGQPVGQAWVLRQLGRRLRAVTGASEGIECLIAYLGAA